MQMDTYKHQMHPVHPSANEKAFFYARNHALGVITGLMDILKVSSTLLREIKCWPDQRAISQPNTFESPNMLGRPKSH